MNINLKKSPSMIELPKMTKIEPVDERRREPHYCAAERYARRSGEDIGHFRQ